MVKIPICTHKKHPGEIKPNKYLSRCRKKGGCPWLEFEEDKNPFNHK